MSSEFKPSEQKVAIAGDRFTIVDRWGSAPSILCIHGIASSRKAWARLAKELSDDHSIAAYDQAGHGDAAAVGGPMTLERCVDDACAVAQSCGSRTRTIIGHSWGGAVALLAALRLPSVERVIAIDPMIFVAPGTWDTDYLDDVRADLRLSPQERERILRSRLARWHELDIVGKIHAMRFMRPDSVERLGRDNRVDDGGWDLRAVVAPYPKPLLVAAADASESVLSAEEFALLGDGASNPHCTLIEFKGEGHNLHRTAFQAFVKAAKAFMAD
jgi:pimeloyl-ACP methyl ester carboxylesterase